MRSVLTSICSMEKYVRRETNRFNKTTNNTYPTVSLFSLVVFEIRNSQRKSIVTARRSICTALSEDHYTCIPSATALHKQNITFTSFVS